MGSLLAYIEKALGPILTKLLGQLLGPLILPTLLSGIGEILHQEVQLGPDYTLSTSVDETSGKVTLVVKRSGATASELDIYPLVLTGSQQSSVLAAVESLISGGGAQVQAAFERVINKGKPAAPSSPPRSP